MMKHRNLFEDLQEDFKDEEEFVSSTVRRANSSD